MRVSEHDERSANDVDAFAHERFCLNIKQFSRDAFFLHFVVAFAVAVAVVVVFRHHFSFMAVHLVLFRLNY